MSDLTQICFIGDCHGKTERLSEILRLIPPEVRKIQLGDMGLGFNGVSLKPVDLVRDNCWFRFIRGNHDDPDKCRRHPNYLGDYGYNPALNLFWLGGAYSIDHEYRNAVMRVNGRAIWRPDEELDEADLKIAYQLYVKTKPSLVATHEAPASIGVALLSSIPGFRIEKSWSTSSRTAVYLERMLQAHAPRRWYFGHYHLDWARTMNRATFRCLNELSYEIYDPEEALILANSSSK